MSILSNIRQFCRQISWRPLILGQVIALFVAGTGVCSQELSRKGVNIPTTQSTLNYVLLSFHIIFHLFQRFKSRKVYENNIVSNTHMHPNSLKSKESAELIMSTPTSQKDTTPYALYDESDHTALLKSQHSTKPKWIEVEWWKYALLALCDVEANYLVVKAYQYTTITSVMLIDCFTIPTVMILSTIFLKRRYRWQHLISVMLCTSGLVALVFSDAIGDDSSGSNPVLGDFLCLIGSFLYAVSNVSQEVIVKRFDRLEFLGMLGLFAVIINGAQLGILEHSELSNLKWNPEIAGLIIGFALCLFLMYELTSIFLQDSDAALFNLSLLTSDLWAVIAGIFLFDQQLGYLYFIAFVAIVSGIIMYNLVAVETISTSASIHTCKTHFQRWIRKRWSHSDITDETVSLVPSITSSSMHTEYSSSYTQANTSHM